MKFKEKITITLPPTSLGAYDSKTYGEEFVGGMIREAVAVLDRHAKPPEIEVKVYDQPPRTPSGFMEIEYSVEFEYISLCSVSQDRVQQFDREKTSTQDVVDAVMTMRAASIGQILLNAIQHPVIYGNSDVMIDMIELLPKQI